MRVIVGTLGVIEILKRNEYKDTRLIKVRVELEALEKPIWEGPSTDHQERGRCIWRVNMKPKGVLILVHTREIVEQLWAKAVKEKPNLKKEECVVSWRYEGDTYWHTINEEWIDNIL